MDLECPVCRENCNKIDSAICSTSCGHIFHEMCIKRWLEISNTCPQCRQFSEIENLRRLYLNSNLQKTNSSFDRNARGETVIAEGRNALNQNEEITREYREPNRSNGYDCVWPSSSNSSINPTVYSITRNNPLRQMSTVRFPTSSSRSIISALSSQDILESISLTFAVNPTESTSTQMASASINVVTPKSTLSVAATAAPTVRKVAAKADRSQGSTRSHRTTATEILPAASTAMRLRSGTPRFRSVAASDVGPRDSSRSRRAAARAAAKAAASPNAQGSTATRYTLRARKAARS